MKEQCPSERNGKREDKRTYIKIEIPLSDPLGKTIKPSEIAFIDVGRQIQLMLLPIVEMIGISRLEQQEECYPNEYRNYYVCYQSFQN